MSRYNQKCPTTNKTIYTEPVARSRVSGWKADERGKWEAYKCPKENHWHVGHKGGDYE